MVISAVRDRGQAAKPKNKKTLWVNYSQRVP